MEKERFAVSPLAEVERETLEEGREWTRRRLEEKLQTIADKQGDLSPPQRETADEEKILRGAAPNGVGTGED